MRSCAKSILNYFAAFNETWFTFSKKLLYRWSDDARTLDLSVFPFPEFEEELLSAVAGNRPLRLTIRQGQHTVEEDGHRLKALMMEALQSKLNQDFLFRATGAAGAAIEPSGNGEQGPEVEARVVQEGLREFNLACRRELQASLVRVQAERIEQLRQVNPIDLPEACRDSVSQQYAFYVLHPSEYPGWFAKLRDGRIAFDVASGGGSEA